jgi:hypothetical protein
MKRLVVRLDRDTATWSWESVPTDDSTLERSPAGHVTAQAAIVDAQKHFGPVDGDVCLRGRKALLR